VTSVLAPRVPVTAELGVLSLVLTVLVGIPLGIWSALGKDGPLDHSTRVGALVFVAVPNFVLALFFVLVFGWWFRNILPYQGFVPLGQSIASNLSHAILPSVCLALGPIGIVVRVTRASMLEQLGSDYVLAARALGVPWRRVVWNDALRNAVAPVLTVLGLVTGYLISGAVVVETIFNLPGLGALLVESFDNRDYTVTISVMMLGAVVFVVVNLLVDLLHAFVNPRVRARWARTS
jgi:peptide/nickel transport system permease protein